MPVPFQRDILIALPKLLLWFLGTFHPHCKERYLLRVVVLIQSPLVILTYVPCATYPPQLFFNFQFAEACLSGDMFRMLVSNVISYEIDDVISLLASASLLCALTFLTAMFRPSHATAICLHQPACMHVYLVALIRF